MPTHITSNYQFKKIICNTYVSCFSNRRKVIKQRIDSGPILLGLVIGDVSFLVKLESKKWLGERMGVGITTIY